MNNYEINIVHMFPDLLNLYGDDGNIKCLEKRLNWRGIKSNIIKCTTENSDINLKNADIVFLGGGSDREQMLVCNELLRKKSDLLDYVNDNGVILAVCGGYQLLGTYYETNGDKIEGLGILNIQTDSGKSRLIGNVVIESDMINSKIVGFENHGGRTTINGHTPLGKVISGYGNDDQSGYEGVIYKNVIATYLHGPLLPKNPRLCDYILNAAIKRKYGNTLTLSPLDDTLENKASEYMIKRILNN